MASIHHTARALKPWSRLLPAVASVMLIASTAFAANAASSEPHAAASVSPGTPHAYCVLPVRSGGLSGYSAFNDKDQIAISGLDAEGRPYALFYDGTSFRDIRSPDGTEVIVRGLNDAGQVAGSYLASDGTFHAFVWNQRRGWRDLGTLGGSGGSTASFARPINNRGQVAGWSSTPSGQEQAFLWSQSDGMRTLGGLPGNPTGFSVAHAINDRGMVAGHGNAAGGDQRAFVWTRGSGMTELPTLGGPLMTAAGISDHGLVVGNAQTAALVNHMVVWSRKEGLRDLGTAGGVETYTSEKPMSSNGNVAGFIRFADGSDHAALWTENTGLIDLGTLGGPVSYAAGVNNQAHVVGAADIDPSDRRGFIWTVRDGMIDLNRRLHDAPPGMTVAAGLAISDGGVILASTSAGFVLLEPDCTCTKLGATGQPLRWPPRH